MGARGRACQVVLPYLGLALDLWAQEAGLAATATGGAAAATDSSDSSDDGSDGDGDGGGSGGASASVAWRAQMATDSGGGAAGGGKEADPDPVVMPDTPRPKMVCDALAVLVVATFKINVRARSTVRPSPCGVCACVYLASPPPPVAPARVIPALQRAPVLGWWREEGEAAGRQDVCTGGWLAGWL